MLTVWVGWDRREAVAADVCRFSIQRHSSAPLRVEMLKQEEMKRRGLYYRTFTTRDGQRYDDLDGRPFSTEFSFTRFLVPELCGYTGWSLFVDCDFLFRADVAELIPLLDDTKAVLVCKQRHRPVEEFKMDGQVQSVYDRKNWSSFMLINCAHPSMRLLTPFDVNTRPGSDLHRFAWLDDNEIGEIPSQWNWIDGVTQGEPKAVHFTAGGPWFPGYEKVAYANEWQAEHDLMCSGSMKAAS